MTPEESVRVKHMLVANDIPFIVKRARWIQETVNSGDPWHNGNTFFGEKPISEEMALMISMYCYGLKGDLETRYSDDPEDYETGFDTEN